MNTIGRISTLSLVVCMFAMLSAFSGFAQSTDTQSRYIDNCDGTITDTVTGLMWQQAPLDAAMTWEDADAYASNLTLGGYDDWRLPYRIELRGLVQGEQPDWAGWLNAQGFRDIQPESYWSGTCYEYKGDFAWVVDMRYGSTTSFTHIDRYCAWAVRGGTVAAGTHPQS